jgi:hypothetical protein
MLSASKQHWQTSTCFPDALLVVCSNSGRLCGLVVRVLGYRSRGPGFDSRRYQIFYEVVGLDRGPLSLVRITDDILEWKSSGSGVQNRN